MLSEAQKMELMHDLSNVNYDYPTGTENYNPNVMIFRKGEFITKKYPAIMIEFLPTMDIKVGGMNNVVSQIKGKVMYGYGEIEPVIITASTKQKCEGTGATYHGRLVAADYINRIEKRIRRYWPKKLWEYGATIKDAFAFRKADVGGFFPGTELQAYELSFYIVSPNKWNYLPDEENIEEGPYFTDAAVFSSGSTEKQINTYFSVSGIMSD